MEIEIGDEVEGRYESEGRKRERETLVPLIQDMSVLLFLQVI